MEKDTIVPTEKGVTIVVSRSVFPGHVREYEEWIRQMVTAASKAPGNVGVTTLIPPKGKNGLYHVVLRFTDQASVDAWEDSPARQQLTAEADRFSRLQRQAATGLETWFTIPDCPQLDTPPSWKQAIVTFIGVYALSTLFIKLAGLFDQGWNFYPENLLISALVVAFLTWVLMPVLTRFVFRKWLFKQNPSV
jgi:antibiotic biosynthesis monooxygenase (ABM) superfamily enzyme